MSTTSSSTPLRRRAALAVAGLTVATLGTSVVHADVAAAAGKAGVKASISLSKTSDKLTGKISSRRKSCESGVRVSLNWRPPGSKSFQQVRTDKTSRKGVWVVQAPQKTIPAGKYFAKTKASKSCNASKSKTITVR